MKPTKSSQRVRQIDLHDLELVDGGLALSGIGAVLGTGSTAPMVQASYGNGPHPQGAFQGAQGMGYPGYVGLGGSHGPGGFGGYGGDPFGHGGVHGGHGGGHHALQEFVHGPAFQSALQQFEGEHPDLVAGLASPDEGQHGLYGLMNDPGGRALLGQFLQDPSFAGALQQFSTNHPHLADRVTHALERIQNRLDTAAPAVTNPEPEETAVEPEAVDAAAEAVAPEAAAPAEAPVDLGIDARGGGGA